MEKRKMPRKPKSEDNPDVKLEEKDFTSEEKTDPEIPVAKAKEEKPLAKVIPLERQILCQEFVRGQGPLGQAFLVEQKLQGRAKKQGRSLWVKEFAAWKARPRT
jgi:hypothetical protein